MRIRMKVKHLIITSIGVMSVAAMLVLLVIPQLTDTEANDIDIPEPEKLFQRLEDESLSDGERLKLIEDDIISQLNVDAYDIYQYPGGAEYKQLGNPSEKEVTYIQEYIQKVPIEKKRAPQNGYYTRAIQGLANYYEKKQEWEKAFEVLEEGMNALKNHRKSEGDYESLYVQKLTMQAYLEPDKTLQEVSKLKPYELREHTYARFLSIHTDLLMKQSRLEEAYQILRKGMEYIDRGNWWVQENLKPTLDRLKAWKDGKDVFTYEGKIQTNDGKALRNVAIYLVESKKLGDSVARKNSPKAITDDKGRFKIEAVQKGDYQVMLGLTLDQVNGYTWPVESDDWVELRSNTKKTITFQPLIEMKSPVNDEMVQGENITFEWEPVEGAQSYDLYLGMDYDGGGTSISSVAKKNITEPSITMSKQAFFHEYYGYSYKPRENKEMKIVPESVLGLSNPNADPYWYVKAYDKNGNLITSSNGFRLSRDQADKIPYFHHEDQKLTEADQLLLDHKIDEALNLYLQNIEKNLDDLHSYRLIYRILSSVRNLNEKHEQMSKIPYLKKLAESTGLPQYWNHLQDEAFREGNWEDYFTYLRKGQGAPEQWSVYTKGRYAIALMKNGNFSKAETYFRKSLQEDGSHRLMPSYVVLKLHENHNFEEAISLAETYPDRGLSQKDWAKRLQGIQKKVKESEAFEKQFHKGIEKYVTLSENNFNEWVDTLENKQLQEFFGDLE